MKKYSNTRATLAIASASFRSILRSPSAVVFSLAFPLIFITVFANIGGSGVSVDVGVAKTCDTINPIYQALKKTSVVNLITTQSTADMEKNLSKGNLDVMIDITKNNALPPYTLNVKYTNSSPQKGGIFKSLLQSIFYKINTGFV